MTTTQTAEVAGIEPELSERERCALAAFLAGHRGLTRDAYARDLRQFVAGARNTTGGCLMYDGPTSKLLLWHRSHPPPPARTRWRCRWRARQNGMMAAQDDVRRLARLAAAVVNRVPEPPLAGSPRHNEAQTLRSAPGDGGAARAELLDNLNVDMQVMIGHLTLIVGGVADALDIASQRDNEVNGPALAYIVRPALELAGQIAWLLSDQIDGAQRVRRYVVWRLADLRAQRLLLREFRASQSETEAAVKELDEMEQQILGSIDAAKWAGRPTKYNGASIEAAALLGADGKPERIPALGELVREVSSTPATYGLLSVTSHSQRFGILQGLEIVSTGGDQQEARVSGFPLKTNLLIGLTVLAVNIPGRMLGGWNSVDTHQLHLFSGELMARAGLR